MSIIAAVGIGQALDGREAAQQASRQALDQIGRLAPTLALVFASYEFSMQSVASGVFSMVGTSAIWGLSTSQPIAGVVSLPRSVVVIVIASNDIKAQVSFWPSYLRNGQEIAQTILLSTEKLPPSILLLAADGLAGDANPLIKHLSVIPTAGCLAHGDPQLKETYVIGGIQAGSGALSTLCLSGNLRMGIGAKHGWFPVGVNFNVTSSTGLALNQLNGKPAVEAYSQWLGHPVSEWIQSPLAELVRLYPLGVEQENVSDLEVCSPNQVAPDGSLCMNIPVKQGSQANLLAGSPQACISAAVQAARQAQAALYPAKPAFALVLADAALQMLMGPQGHPELTAIRSILGDEIPLGGAFTLGQICSKDALHPEQVLNGHITILLFGQDPE